MKTRNKPKLTTQGGYVVAWACFLIATVGVVVQSRNAFLQTQKTRSLVAENTDRLLAQIRSIQTELASCSYRLQRLDSAGNFNSSSRRSVANIYPVTPTGGELRDVVCAPKSGTGPKVWSSSDFSKIQATPGFSEWHYQYNETDNTYTLEISTTNSERASIAAFSRIQNYVSPPQNVSGQGSSPEPVWLNGRVKVANTSDGQNQTMTIYSEPKP